MDEERRNPDVLLERVSSDETSRGRLKVYLGMAAGSGKTFAMLSDAIREKKRGEDVVAGYIEPHGRLETENLAKELESLPFKRILHKGIQICEFDLAAALARRPKVLLIDELAHTNAPGARHKKRWQDVEECLSQGINVYTTVNVQHVESLSDVVQNITGVQITEVVPDHVIRKAEEIELIDITPEELTQRIKDGKVYIREKAETALNNFFRPGNLLALRELVLRLTADRVDEQLKTFRRQHEVREVWPTRPRVLVCVSPNFLSEKVVRSASRLALSLQTDLVAVSIDPTPSHLPDNMAISSETSIELAERLGAHIVKRTSIDVVGEILRVAREHNANIIVVGKPIRSRLTDYFYGSVVDDIIRQSGELDVYVITGFAKESLLPSLIRPVKLSKYGVLRALVLVGVATGVCAIAEQFLDISNLAMIYLLSVAWAATRWGRFESIVTAVLSVLAFDFCFVPPRWTFAVSDVQYFVTFLVMLVIGLLISTLTARMKSQAELVARRERRTAALYDLSRLLASAATQEQIAKIVFDQAKAIFGLDAALFLLNTQGELGAANDTPSMFEREVNELAVARWVSDRGVPAGSGTMTLAGAKGYYVPLPGNEHKSVVLGIAKVGLVWDAEQRSIFEAFSSQVASTLERVYAETIATKQKVDVERERLRNVLLSSVSHDFRTPLTAITGAVDTLLNRDSSAVPEDLELLQSVKVEADNLSRMVRNVLDLTKLESGQMRLNLEWEALEEVIGAALRRTQPQLGNRKISVCLASELPLIRVDASLLSQVFVNLFENIARHAPNSTEVTIEGEMTESKMRISVTDDGPGLPQGSEKRIFDKAFRGNKDTEGFGLGLTICSVVMQAHGGEIEALNNTNGGAKFILTLPIAEPQPEVTYVA